MRARHRCLHQSLRRNRQALRMAKANRPAKARQVPLPGLTQVTTGVSPPSGVDGPDIDQGFEVAVDVPGVGPRHGQAIVLDASDEGFGRRARAPIILALGQIDQCLADELDVLAVPSPVLAVSLSLSPSSALAWSESTTSPRKRPRRDGAFHGLVRARGPVAQIKIAGRT